MNAQPATLPAQAEPSDFFPELLPSRPRRRRTGDIARLPIPVQDSVNRMLDEGVPYAEIAKRLGPDGHGLTKQKLSRWRYGAHQDYLRKQDLATRTRLLTEFAAELVVQPGADPDQVARVCREVAAAQMLTTLLDHGKDALGTALKSDPSTVFRLFNTICNVSESCIAAEKARHLFAALPLQPSVPPSPEQSRPVLDKDFCNERASHSTDLHPENVAASPSQSHLVSDKKLTPPTIFVSALFRGLHRELFSRAARLCECLPVVACAGPPHLSPLPKERVLRSPPASEA